MYSLNIHNVTKVEFKITKLFNNFISRDLEITTTDYEGKQTQHTIGLYGKKYTDLCPLIDNKSSHHYSNDDDDTKQTAA